MKLERRLVPKPWGRTRLPPIFGNTQGERIGEVWFAGRSELPLLAKYIFTSERLSIQNHPSDSAVRSLGLPHGKEECWYVLEAEPGTSVGLGWTRDVTRDEIRTAAADGSIIELLDWKSVREGDFYYVPAGTVHAIGAGISLLEFQQNTDVTYRLYDYGRPRELHLDEAIAVAQTGPYSDSRSRSIAPDESTILVEGPPFSLAHVVGNAGEAHLFEGRRRWALPIEGIVAVGDEEAGAGECLLIEGDARIDRIEGRVLIGAAGSTIS